MSDHLPVVWIPLQGYEETHEVQMATRRIRKRSSQKVVKVSSTGRVCLHKVWIHVVDLFAPACKQVTPVRINWMTTVINVFLVAALAITVWIFERQK